MIRKSSFIFCATFFFTPPVLTAFFIIPPVQNWLNLHQIYTTQEIQNQHITIVNVTNTNMVTFSNGEKHDCGNFPVLIIATILFASAGIGLLCVRFLSKLFAPKIYNDLFEKQVTCG